MGWEGEEMGGRREGRGGEREGREKGRGGTCSKVLGGIDAPGTIGRLQLNAFYKI